MSYKTELHCHCNLVSPCSDVGPEEIVRQYLEYGYSTVVITDHLSERVFSSFPQEMSDRDRMDYFLNGYRKVKEYAGDKLNILLGAEIRFPGTGGTDFLIFGPDENFFLNNADVYKHERFWTGALAHNNNCLFYQSHPFRFGMMLCEDFVIDGIEVYNGHPEQESHNRIAEEWLKEFPKLKGISGTDHHSLNHLPDAGILTDVPITNNRQLVEILKSGSYSLIKDNETRKKAINMMRK